MPKHNRYGSILLLRNENGIDCCKILHKFAMANRIFLLQLRKAIYTYALYIQKVSISCLPIFAFLALLGNIAYSTGNQQQEHRSQF